MTGLNIRNLSALALSLLFVLVAACGGGGGGGGAGTPAPGPTPQAGGTVSGQILGDPADADLFGSRATAQAGIGNLVGIPGIEVRVESEAGDDLGGDITDDSGNFRIDDVPPGNVRVKLRIRTQLDFNGDGTPDEVEIKILASVSQDQITQLIEQIGLIDLDGDGQPDGILLRGTVVDNGQQREHTMGFDPSTNQTFSDTNGNGVVDVDDASFEDNDLDGVPDDLTSQSEVEVKGTVDSLDDQQIVVGGISFLLSPTTLWLDDHGMATSRDYFAAGSCVEVKGYRQDEDLLAVRVKAEDDCSLLGIEEEEVELEGTIDSIDETQITVRGVTFSLSPDTICFDENQVEIPCIDLSPGDFVEVKGVFSPQGLIAEEVKLDDLSPDAHEDDVDHGQGIEFEGVVDEVGDGTVTVGGQIWDTTQAQCYMDDGSSIDCSEIQPGMLVEIEGYQAEDGALVATEVEVEEELAGDEHQNGDGDEAGRQDGDGDDEGQDEEVGEDEHDNDNQAGDGNAGEGVDDGAEENDGMADDGAEEHEDGVSGEGDDGQEGGDEGLNEDGDLGDDGNGGSPDQGTDQDQTGGDDGSSNQEEQDQEGEQEQSEDEGEEEGEQNR